MPVQKSSVLFSKCRSPQDVLYAAIKRLNLSGQPSDDKIVVQSMGMSVAVDQLHIEIYKFQHNATGSEALIEPCLHP